MGYIAVGTVDRGVSAGWTLLANWTRVRVLLGLVGVCTDHTAGIVPAQSCWVAVGLALEVLSVSSVRNIIIQLALTVTDNEVLIANADFLDIACQHHNHCGVCLMLSSLSWGKPSGGLPLDELQVVGGETL